MISPSHQKYFIHKRLRTEELLHNLRPNFQRNRFLELFTLPCDKCPPIKCKFLISKSIRLCNGWYSWYSCSRNCLKYYATLCYSMVQSDPISLHQMLWNIVDQFKYPCIKYPCIIWYQTSAAKSPMFWFQPRPPPRWPVANGRRRTKAVTLKNTIIIWNLVLLMSSVLLSLMSSVLL